MSIHEVHGCTFEKITGSFLFGQEYLVKNADRVELMSMLGFFGAIISAIQMYPWDKPETDFLVFMCVKSQFIFFQ